MDIDNQNDEQDQGFKYKLQIQHEQIDRKNPSAGDSNTTKFQYVQNQHRDTTALFIAHSSMLDTVALSQNVTRRRAQFQMMQSMALPVGLENNQ
eukprot:UN03501